MLIGKKRVKIYDGAVVIQMEGYNELLEGTDGGKQLSQ
jgi:hypothetical protein